MLKTLWFDLMFIRYYVTEMVRVRKYWRQFPMVAYHIRRGYKADDALIAENKELIARIKAKDILIGELRRQLVLQRQAKAQLQTRAESTQRLLCNALDEAWRLPPMERMVCTNGVTESKRLERDIKTASGSLASFL